MTLKSKKKWLSVQETAHAFGIAKQSVQWAVTNKRIGFRVKNGRREIDYEVAAKHFGPKKIEDAPVVPGEVHDQMSLNEAERQEKIYKAMRQKLEYEKAKGKLINIDEAISRVADMARRTREALQGISDRLAPELAAEVDPHRVAVMVRREVDLALEQLADRILLHVDDEPNQIDASLHDGDQAGTDTDSK